MLRSYLAAAMRNLARNRLYAAINIVGLAIGFTASILIALFVRHELTFDSFIPGHANIYRVSMSRALPGHGSSDTEDLRNWMTLLLQQDLPQIEALARLSNTFGGVSLRRGDVEANESGFYWADPNIFDVLPLPVFKGDLRTALERPDGIVLTRRMARKYFGRDDPLGETIEIDRTRTMQVTAILEDLPSNTHLNTEALASGTAVSGPRDALGSGGARVYAYLRLRPGTSLASMRSALKDFVDRHWPKPSSGKPSDTDSLPLLRIGDIHLHPGGAFAMTPAVDPGTVHAIAIVGVLIVLLAGINFVNLMTARATRRATEVGVRKVCGGRQRDLIVQFIGESILYAALGMLIATVLVELLLLPHLNRFLDRNIVFDYWHLPMLGALATLVFVIGTLAGTYPAFVIASFRPATVLKSAASPVTGSGKVRQLLVLTQFAILVGLVLATVTIYRQTEFGLQQGLRFDRDQLLTITVPYPECENGAFRNGVEALAGVRGTACSEFFVNDYGTDQYLAPDGSEVTLQNSQVGAGLFELLGLKPVAGRFFEANRQADAFPAPRDRSTSATYRVVVNETAARQLGFASPAAALGRTFALHSGERREIIGVVPDFSRDTVRQRIEGMIFENPAGWFSRLNVKLRGNAIPETLREIDRLWETTARQPRPISRLFYDQYVQELYRSLIRQSVLFAGFAGVALFLAGLGLFGLAAFTAERRTKEIGIRKAMGAETGDLTRLLLWQFSKPVLWANLIAWPVAGYVMHRWLHGFAYHIDLELWLFAASGALALAIALLTVTMHSLRVARAKPVAALRYE